MSSCGCFAVSIYQIEVVLPYHETAFFPHNAIPSPTQPFDKSQSSCQVGIYNQPDERILSDNVACKGANHAG